jgi:hypothetical protein
MKQFELVAAWRWICLVCALLMQFPLHAQEIKRGAITGRVIDKTTKEPIVGATVKVVGLELGAVADLDGKFTIQNIPVGTYQVKISAVGYESTIRSDVVVSTARAYILGRRVKRKRRCRSRSRSRGGLFQTPKSRFPNQRTKFLI